MRTGSRCSCLRVLSATSSSYVLVAIHHSAPNSVLNSPRLGPTDHLGRDHGPRGGASEARRRQDPRLRLCVHSLHLLTLLLNADGALVLVLHRLRPSLCMARGRRRREEEGEEGGDTLSRLRGLVWLGEKRLAIMQSSSASTHLASCPLHTFLRAERRSAGRRDRCSEVLSRESRVIDADPIASANLILLRCHRLSVRPRSAALARQTDDGRPTSAVFR